MASAEDRKEKQREKVQDYRARMRARGLRPVQIWVPDTRTPAFAAAAHEHSLAVARRAPAADHPAFVDALSEASEA
jgi:hypothetical protein